MEWTLQVLRVIPATGNVVESRLRKLKTICSRHATLSYSYIVSGKIARVSGGPTTVGVIAGVWEGTHGSKKVLIKRLSSSDLQ